MPDLHSRRIVGDNYRLSPGPSDWTPPDPPEDGRVFECPTCGIWYAEKSYAVAHDFRPCEGRR